MGMNHTVFVIVRDLFIVVRSILKFLFVVVNVMIRGSSCDEVHYSLFNVL